MGKVGRPKGSGGSQHTATILGSVRDAALERVAKRFETETELLSPLEVLVSIMNGETTDFVFSKKRDEIVEIPIDAMTRVAAASAALPYIHSKMPEALEISGPDGGPIDVITQQQNVEFIVFGSPLYSAPANSIVSRTPEAIDAPYEQVNDKPSV